MIYVLLIVFPLVIAISTFLLRRDAALTAWLGVAAVAGELWLVLSAPVDQPARLLDISVNYSALNQLFLVTFCLGSLAMALLAAYRPHGERFVAMLLATLGLGAAMLIVQEPFISAALLLLASLMNAAQLIDQPVGSPALLQPRTIGMALKYTLLMTLGGVLLLIGFVLATAFTGQLAASGPNLNRVVFGLLLIGFAIRAGLMPFHLWLPDVVDETPPPTIFVQLGLLTILSLPVLLAALQTQPQLLVGNPSGQRLLMGLGAITALLGAGRAAATNRSRRAVGYLALANMGLIAIGLATTNGAGVASALLGAVSHVAAIALLTLGLALLEYAVPGRREQAGLLRERPIAALALLLGVLLLLGVPPLVGWLPKLLLVSSTAGNRALTGLVALALAMNGLAGARLLRRLLLQPSEAPSTRALFSDDLDRLAVVNVPYAPRALQLMVLALAALVVAAGIWPAPLVGLVDEAIRALPFLVR